MRKMILLAIAAFATVTPRIAAQDKVETSIAADFVSGYIWRGQDLGNVSIQPGAGIAYKGFSLGAWGSVGIDKEDTKELDITAAYKTGGFNVGITDYWFNNTADARYFMYKSHRTAHVFEANVGYDFGVVSLQWYTNFAGNDGRNKDGDRAYSSYVEASAPFKLGGADWTATVGAVPYRTDFYSDADGFAITNVTLKASKDIKVTRSFSLPIFAAVTANPSDGKAYLAIGFTLQP